MNNRGFVRILFAILILTHVSAAQSMAQEKEPGAPEVRRLLNLAFELWLENPGDEKALREDVERMARIGFVDDAVICIERAIAKNRMDDVENAIDAVIQVLLDRGQQPGALALIDQFDGSIDKETVIPKWSDRALSTMVSFHVSENDLDKAVEITELMVDRRTKNPDKRTSLQPHEWNCCTMIAERYVRNGERERGLTFLNSFRSEIPAEDMKNLIEAAIETNDIKWALEQVERLPIDHRWLLLYHAFEASKMDGDWPMAEKVAEAWTVVDAEDSAEAFAAIAFACNDTEIANRMAGLAILACSPLPDEAFSILVARQIKTGNVDEALKMLSDRGVDLENLERDLRRHLVWAMVDCEHIQGRTSADALLQAIEPAWLCTRVKLDVARERLQSGDRIRAAELVDEVRVELDTVPQTMMHEFWSSGIAEAFSEFGFYDEARKFLNRANDKTTGDWQLGIRFQIAEKMLHRGDHESGLKILEVAGKLPELPPNGPDVIVAIAMHMDADKAIRVLNQTSGVTGAHVADVLEKFVQSGEGQAAREFWLAAVDFHSGRNDDSQLENETTGALFVDDLIGSHLVEEIQAYEKVFSGSPQAMVSVLMAYARLGRTSTLLNGLKETSGDWTNADVYPLIAMLVEVGELPELLGSEHPIVAQILKEHEIEFQTRHQLLVGNTTEATRLVESVADKSVRRRLLIQCAEQRSSPWMEKLRAIDNWLESVVSVSEGGYVQYPVAIESPEVAELNLYHGLSGILLFYSRMHEVTNDEIYRMRQRKIARSISSQLDDMDMHQDPGLFTGYSGAAFAFRRSWNWKHYSSIRKCASRLAESAQESTTRSGRKAVRWNDTTDLISGTAGIGLLLLDFNDNLSRINALDLAMAAGDDLLDRAEKVDLEDSEFGFRWQMNPGYDREMPNYSHGTAGICRFLLELHWYCEINSQSYMYAKPGLVYHGRFHKAALAGARYLASMNTKQQTPGWLPHHFPGGEELFYLGWCHGPPGTCQLANLLYGSDSTDSWNDYSRSATDQILTAALHKNRTEGFWNNIGICCGSSGVGSFLLDQSILFDDRRYEEEARRIARDILDRGTLAETSDGRPTLCWTSAEHRVRPDFLQTQTGLMQGAAGVGLFLLQMETHHRGDPVFSIFRELLP